jgi:hypothetical protein
LIRPALLYNISMDERVYASDKLRLLEQRDGLRGKGGSS